MTQTQRPDKATAIRPIVPRWYRVARVKKIKTVDIIYILTAPKRIHAETYLKDNIIACMFNVFIYRKV